MQIVNSISERNAVKNAVLFVAIDGGKWAVYVEGDELPQAAPAPVAFPPITAWRLRQVLNAAGLRQAVENAVSASGNQDLIDGWEYATEYERYHPLIVSMGAALGLDAAALDTLWAQAVEI